MNKVFYFMLALVFTTSNVSAAKFGDFALNNKSEIKSLNDSNLSANAFLQLEFIPHTNKFAGVYWLPDYVENNNGYGYGGRINDGDAPSGETAKCSDYGLLSCTPPKIGVNKKPIIGTSLVCYTSCKCAAASNCTSEYSLTRPSDNAVMASCQVIDSNSCAQTSTKYKVTGCNDGYVLNSNGVQCNIRTCPSGFTAGLTKATCPNTTDTYTTDGKSGPQVCGKCTVSCSTSVYTKTNASCKSEHSDFRNWKADTTKMCGTNSSACVCSPVAAVCSGYDKTTSTRGSCTYGYEMAGCNNGCESKYKCKGCTINDCSVFLITTPPTNASFTSCSPGCGTTASTYMLTACNAGYVEWCNTSDLSCWLPNSTKATCAIQPSCATMGYTMSTRDCGTLKSLKCPYDTSKIFCFK